MLSSLKSPMQILSGRSARSELPMSNAVRKQLGLDCEDLRTKYKNEHLPSLDFHINQQVMYQDPMTRRVKMNIYCNLIICRQSKMRRKRLILMTIKYNLDQRVTLSLQLNWIYKVQCDYLAIRLDIS